MSPEQARGEPLDPRSDISSLGVILFELFTGVLPINAANVAAMIHKKLHEPLTFDTAAAARLPVSVTPILRKALAVAAADRYASTRELRAALIEARAETAVADGDAAISLATKALNLRDRAPAAPNFTHSSAVSPAARRAALVAAAILGGVTLIAIVVH
jgi:serine/threonine protein kinase